MWHIREIGDLDADDHGVEWKGRPRPGRSQRQVKMGRFETVSVSFVVNITLPKEEP
ncbi:MAG TPA: hypothetical protein VH519_03415 [Hyphomicrobiaceae bacterium]